MSCLGIMNLIPAVYFQRRKHQLGTFTDSFRSITRMWHASCYPIINITLRAQILSDFFENSEPECRPLLTCLKIRSLCYGSCKDEKLIEADTFIPLAQFINLSDICLEWKCEWPILRIFALCVNIRKVTIICKTSLDMKMLVTAIDGWPLLECFTLRYATEFYITPIICHLTQSCTHLHSFVILSYPDDNVTELSEALIKLIGLHGPTLTRLVLRNIHCINDNVLLALATLAPNLKELDISGQKATYRHTFRDVAKYEDIVAVVLQADRNRLANRNVEALWGIGDWYGIASFGRERWASNWGVAEVQEGNGIQKSLASLKHRLYYKIHITYLSLVYTYVCDVCDVCCFDLRKNILSFYNKSLKLSWPSIRAYSNFATVAFFFLL